ncbi:hypothetical protein [Nonomuraea recticatena]|uniref:PPE family protein n=1 Tax=Nonomuraea recticatena TaxID=46178 RepID=A0ABP6FWK3_9ACTN
MIATEYAKYAEVASLVGVPAELFVWDPDALDGIAGTISAFLRNVSPGIQEAESAAGQYTAATRGAEGGAFDQHWQAIAAGGDSGDLHTMAGWAAGLVSLGAIAIKIAQTGVLTQLAWCAPQLAASIAAGPASALNAIRAIATARATIGAIVRQLTDRLDRSIAPKLRQVSELLRRLGRQFDPRTALNGGHRLRPADGPGHLPDTPGAVTKHVPLPESRSSHFGADQMYMGRRSDAQKAARFHKEQAAFWDREADKLASIDPGDPNVAGLRAAAQRQRGLADNRIVEADVFGDED